MSQTLGEKLRAAREARGISISEVAEQTRISPLYLEAIDADNYKTLPGGIFNKGFVRSYAKYVGVDEQEALQDYSRQIAQVEPVQEAGEFKTYRPEVLTDDRAASSIIPTVLFAAVILGLMTAGVLFLVNYIQEQQSQPQIAVNTSSTNTSTNANREPEANSAPAPAAAVPAMGAIKVEFKTGGEDIWLSSQTDGTRGSTLVTADKPAVFEPKQQLRLSYSRSLAQVAQLSINGKQITLPTAPAAARRNVIEIDINNNNLASVWQNASFAAESAAAPAIDANNAPAPVTPRPQQRPASTPRPAAANTNSTAAPPTMTGRPPATRPAATPAAEKPPSNGVTLN